MKSLLTLHATMTRPGMQLTGRDITLRANSQGYSKCGYHYVIQRDGVVYQGRKDHEPSIHDDNDAKAAISVCLVGGVDDFDTPTNNFTLPQWEALKHLLNAVMSLHSIPKVTFKTPSVDAINLDGLLI